MNVYIANNASIMKLLNKRKNAIIQENFECRKRLCDYEEIDAVETIPEIKIDINEQFDNILLCRNGKTCSKDLKNTHCVVKTCILCKKKCKMFAHIECSNVKTAEEVKQMIINNRNARYCLKCYKNK